MTSVELGGSMRMDHRLRSRALVAATLAAALAATLVPGIAAADSGPGVTVVASGLNNPRGIAIAPNGAIYVAEAGSGGAGPCMTSPEGETVCLGATGAIARIRPGSVERVVTGLPSLAAADGSAAGGPHKLSFQGHGNLYLTIGLGGTPDDRAALGNGARRLGTIVRANVHNGTVRRVADLAAYEAKHNPDQGDPGSEVDSNPYGILATPFGVYSTDAGGNDLLFTDHRGRTRTVAVLHATLVDAPPFLGLPAGTKIPLQAVPTGIARGRDGALYVSQLTGFPFPVGGSSIWRFGRARADRLRRRASPTSSTSRPTTTATSTWWRWRRKVFWPPSAPATSPVASSRSRPTAARRRSSRARCSHPAASPWVATAPSTSRTCPSPPAAARFCASIPRGA